MPLNVNFDGTGWNADYVATLREGEFVQQFDGHYSHIREENQRVNALEMTYRFIIGKWIEKPRGKPNVDEI